MPMIDEIQSDLKKYRLKKYRVRSIFKKYRNLNKFYYLSDLILLNIIVLGLRKFNLPYSNKEIYAAFQLIDINDYPAGTKKKMLYFLTEGSKNKSVF